MNLTSPDSILTVSDPAKQLFAEEDEEVEKEAIGAVEGDIDEEIEGEGGTGGTGGEGGEGEGERERARGSPYV